MGTINKVFLYNGTPQNGATAQLWKITAFAAYVDSTATVQDNPLAATSVECLTSNGAVFAIGDVIRMGTEYCLIWAKSGNTIYIIRGWHQSTPAQHVQNTVIYDETVTPPVVDDAVPGAGQQGGNITTGVAYGGDGAYRFDDVPEMEYYASVTYDAHITYSHCFVERNDITPEQILTVDGDLLLRNADTITRLPKGNNGDLLQQGANRASWVASGGFVATREKFFPAIATTNIGDYAVWSIGAADTAYISGHFPHDFTTISEFVIILVPGATDNATDIDLDSDYATEGALYNANSEAEAAATYDLTINQMFELDVTTVFTGPPSADDYFGIKIVNNEVGMTLLILGARLKYT